MKHEVITKHARFIPKIQEIKDLSGSMNLNARCAKLITEIKELKIRLGEIYKFVYQEEKRFEMKNKDVKNEPNNIKKKCEEIWNALNPLIKLIEDIKKIDVYTKFTELIKKTENINSKLRIVEGYNWDYSALHFGMYFFLFLSRSKLIFNYSFRKRG